MFLSKDLEVALEKQLSMTEQQMANYRMCWCRKWLARAAQLADAEKEDLVLRPDHVRQSTATKRLLLTGEILEDLGYEDMGVIGIMRNGATLAGDVAPCPIFKQQFRPCLATLKQLEAGAPKRNQAILRMSTSCEDSELDVLLLEETKLEVEKGWAEGPFELDQLEKGAVISRRFPLRQGGKVRLIDDYSVSGINECTSTHNKIDLHMIDAFAGLMREFFRQCEQLGLDSAVLAKTYDLKSAYRQVPIRADHLKFAYFSIYNHERNRPEIYRMKTLPFGATHSVYNFLRLARALHSIAARGLYLLNTNFYDCVLGRSPLNLFDCSSAEQCACGASGQPYRTRPLLCDPPSVSVPSVFATCAKSSAMMQEMSPQICVDPGLTVKARMAPVLTGLVVMSCGHKRM